jgi:hypothetical protein
MLQTHIQNIIFTVIKLKDPINPELKLRMGQHLFFYKRGNDDVRGCLFTVEKLQYALYELARVRHHQLKTDIRYGLRSLSQIFSKDYVNFENSIFTNPKRRPNFTLDVTKYSDPQPFKKILLQKHMDNHFIDYIFKKSALHIALTKPELRKQLGEHSIILDSSKYKTRSFKTFYDNRTFIYDLIDSGFIADKRLTYLSADSGII